MALIKYPAGSGADTTLLHYYPILERTPGHYTFDAELADLRISFDPYSRPWYAQKDGWTNMYRVRTGERGLCALLSRCSMVAKMLFWTITRKTRKDRCPGYLATLTSRAVSLALGRDVRPDVLPVDHRWRRHRR